MKTSALISHLTDVMNAFGDPLIVVPSYVENRYQAVERVEVIEMVLCANEGPAARTSCFRTRDPSEPVTAAIVLRGSR
jgi:hypothetical protein